MRRRRHHRGRGQGRDPPRKQLLTGVGGSHLRVRGGGGEMTGVGGDIGDPLLMAVGVVSR
jgi:hypothetical protein